MTNFGKLIVIILCLMFLVLVVYFLQRTPATVLIENKAEPLPNQHLTTDREVLGNKEDLINFSILPNSAVSGVVKYNGSIKGGYFFEGNILVNVLDGAKNPLKEGNATAKTDWMTVEPVEFEGSIDFSNLPKSPAYIEIHNDNASGLPENDKSVLIPVLIN